ncbi:histidine phosphatase superfamily-domain-containing protein [Mycena latifolia]|nr:histidine phosphatase superfamily-domain-containing protein [Mycena latifolia]
MSSRSRISNFFHSPEKSSNRSSSVITRSSSPASSSSHSISDMSLTSPHSPNKLHQDSADTITPKYLGKPMVLGVCAMDVKARSKAMREILTRLVERAHGGIEVKVFGDKVILDEDVENWPRCDVLISFFSTDFPLDKAISYVKLRSPFCINDLSSQALLWDRRLVGAVLDHLKVPTPTRLEVSRDGGPRVENELKDLIKTKLGLTIGGFTVTPEVTLREDGNAIIIDGQVLEKPVYHNVYIYFRGGGGRRLFRKACHLDPNATVGNKSSDLDATLNHPRTDGSYIYEQFIDVDNSEDIKVYTVGQEYTHAETRKSPVVDGVVRRNTDGKEIRFITRLSEEEKTWAKKICEGFGQRVCGYDMLRCDNGQRSQVIDVNGWSFVKGNESYYDKAAEILATLCMRLSSSPDRPLPAAESTTQEAPTWLLKANVTVFRHADRTPKQKLKFNFPIGESWTQPFAKSLGAGGEDLAKLTQLSNALFSKIDLPGTKAQLKPVYSKRQAGQVRRLTKLTLVFKWGGEFTHSARYQSRDLGENMKKDISIMNKDALNNVKIFTSSERRVIASAEIFAAALVDSQNSTYSLPSSTPSSISSRSSTDIVGNGHLNKATPAQTTANQTPLNLIVRKDLLDDSNAAKDLMDDVKKRLKILLRPGEPEKRPELTWPKSMNKEPVEVVKEVIELLSSFRGIMRKNFETMDVDKIQERWCCGDEPWLFRERWEKLFEDFCDVEQKKFDPSRVSELYDTIKYCALHHRTFLFAIFDEHGRSDPLQPPRDRKLHELYGRAKALFDLVAPQEYGIDPEEKEEIGVLTSLPLLRNVVEDLEAARNNGGSSLTLYFTKESHIHTLVNLVLQSGLPIANRRIPELDYCVGGTTIFPVQLLRWLQPAVTHNLRVI